MENILNAQCHQISVSLKKYPNTKSHSKALKIGHHNFLLREAGYTGIMDSEVVGQVPLLYQWSKFEDLALFSLASL